MHRVIKFNQEAWSKQYTDLSTEVRKNAKNDFQKYYFKLTNRQFLEKL